MTQSYGKKTFVVTFEPLSSESAPIIMILELVAFEVNPDKLSATATYLPNCFRDMKFSQPIQKVEIVDAPERQVKVTLPQVFDWVAIKFSHHVLSIHAPLPVTANMDLVNNELLAAQFGWIDEDGGAWFRLEAIKRSYRPYDMLVEGCEQMFGVTGDDWYQVKSRGTKPFVPSIVLGATVKELPLLWVCNSDAMRKLGYSQ